MRDIGLFVLGCVMVWVTLAWVIEHPWIWTRVW